MSLPDISIRVLTPETDLTAFKCAEGDLNEFLLDESKDYQTEYLAVTYLLVNSENGDIIVALLNGENTLKRLRYDANGRPYLHPENPVYPDIMIHEGDRFYIQGVLIYAIKAY